MRRSHAIIFSLVMLVLIVATCGLGALAGRSLAQRIVQESPELVGPLTGMNIEPTVDPYDPLNEIEPDIFPEEPTPTPAPVDGPTLPPEGAPLGLNDSLNLAGDAALQTNTNAPRYNIIARFEPDRYQLTGTQTVVYTNTTQTALDTIVFRMYANHTEPFVAASDITVNGESAVSDVRDNGSILEIELPTSLAPGQSVTLGMAFTSNIPTGADIFDGLFGEENGIYTLYSWHPELSVINDGKWADYSLDRATKGDASSTDIANYTALVDTPEDVTLVSTGIETLATGDDGRIVYQISSALTRNLVLVASTQFIATEQQVGDTMVTSYALAGHENANAHAVDTAAASLEQFTQDFGAYPFRELDVVESPLYGGAGMEATGLILIGNFYYDNFDLWGSYAEEGTDGFTFTIAHEVAHQWWYSVVGNSPIEHPWLDESLTNWSAVRYTEARYGDDAGDNARDLFTAIDYHDQLRTSGDVRLDQPLDAFDDYAYSTIVYGKGSLMYDALRAEIGDDAFFGFLKDYYTTMQFRTSTPADWQAALTRAVGSDRATDFYRLWVEGDALVPEDLPPLGAYGKSYYESLEVPTVTP